MCGIGIAQRSCCSICINPRYYGTKAIRKGQDSRQKSKKGQLGIQGLWVQDKHSGSDLGDPNDRLLRVHERQQE